MKLSNGLLLALISWMLLSACSTKQTYQENSSTDKPLNKLVSQAIASHGGERYESFSLAFDFRGKHYTASRKGGLYIYTREFKDSLGNSIIDKLDNEGFVRSINGEKSEIPQEKSLAYSNSVNSVIYFTLLPFGLNDPAVNTEDLGVVNVKGEPYHKIKITFDQEGGGTDYEDEYIYWVHQQKHTVDFLAYSYHVNGGGIRFREAINRQTIQGIIFQDYINYKPDNKDIAIENIDRLFEAGELKELSRIENKNIELELTSQ
ncbi:DUF6503 family protein [Rapidithrix thailandica]|uniref:DUF6503 family protein n=1 Tax=Rapidithrix thailandica TaxID=413964 RepID=A0AAW9RRX6_9BACT